MKRTIYDPINLLSLNDLAWRLREKKSYLHALGEDAESHYRPFTQLKKGKPYQAKTPTKQRAIDNPSVELKRLQRKIISKLLGHLEAPHFLFGAVKGKTIHDNAALHKEASLIVKMDIKNYYPNVTTRMVNRVWKRELGCSREVARVLTALTTFKGRLPQGAPTSPLLANIYMASIFPPILEQCEELGVTVGIFVDDIVFSGEHARRMMEPTRRLLARDGLKFSAKKREILGSKDSFEVTGIRIGRDGLRAPKKKVKDLRAAFHKLEIDAIRAEERPDYLKSLTSKVAHVHGICEKDAAPFQAKLTTQWKELPTVRA